MIFPDLRILVFARAPRAGVCKTRLIPALGKAGAAHAQQRLAESSLRTAARSRLAPVELHAAPDARHGFFLRARRRHALQLRRQSGRDLGARMAAAMQKALRSARGVIVIGTDCPALDEPYLRRACAALRDHDVVVGPAADGGYVLVGARRHRPQLFAGIAWGGPRVLAMTRQRLRRLGLDWVELPALWDVDTPRDWRRARRWLRHSGV